jgi:hypothetical protein
MPPTRSTIGLSPLFRLFFSNNLWSFLFLPRPCLFFLAPSALVLGHFWYRSMLKTWPVLFLLRNIVELTVCAHSKEVRKSIARVLTALTSHKRDALRELYAGKKYKPLDLRPKKTRAIRRALTKEQVNRKTLRELKRERAFPMRKYAVKA